MAKCPKCGKKLRLTDWKPECPGCGVNMVYYNSDERLLADSEKAEIEHALSQPGIDRAKAAFFGSPKAIIRIVLSLIPIAALFLPLWTVTDKNGSSANINIIGLYKTVNSVSFGKIFSSLGKGDLLSIGVTGLLISAILILIGVICLFMSLGKHGVLRNRIINFTKLAGAMTGIFTVLASIMGQGLLYDGEAEKASVGIGSVLYLILIVALIIYNEYLTKTGLPVKHTQCLIGGLPSEEYFSLVEQGASELEIRKKMVDALTVMQNEIRAKAAEAEKEKMKKAMNRK